MELGHGPLGMSRKHAEVNQGPLGAVGVSIAREAGWREIVAERKQVARGRTLTWSHGQNCEWNRLGGWPLERTSKWARLNMLKRRAWGARGDWTSWFCCKVCKADHHAWEGPCTRERLGCMVAVAGWWPWCSCARVCIGWMKLLSCVRDLGWRLWCTVPGYGRPGRGALLKLGCCWRLWHAGGHGMLCRRDGHRHSRARENSLCCCACEEEGRSKLAGLRM